MSDTRDPDAVKHSPLPWRVRVEGDHKSRVYAGQKIVCSLPMCDTPVRHVSTGFSPGYDVAPNAALIVRAVNAHDDLVAALDKIVNNWGDLHPKDRQQARAALANAKGGAKKRCPSCTATFLGGYCRNCGRPAMPYDAPLTAKPAEDAPKIMPIACHKCGHYVANEPHTVVVANDPPTVVAYCRRCAETIAAGEDAPQEQEPDAVAEAREAFTAAADAERRAWANHLDSPVAYMFWRDCETEYILAHDALLSTESARDEPEVCSTCNNAGYVMTTVMGENEAGFPMERVERVPCPHCSAPQHDAVDAPQEQEQEPDERALDAISSPEWRRSVWPTFLAWIKSTGVYKDDELAWDDNNIGPRDDDVHAAWWGFIRGLRLGQATSTQPEPQPDAAPEEPAEREPGEDG